VAPEVTEMEIEIGRVVDALPGLVWTSTPDGHADFLNRRWLEYTGLAEDEAKGIGWQSALHPDDATAALQFWGERVAAGAAGEVEARLRRFDGVYRWFQFRFVPLADDSGKVIKWCGINTDIDDLKCAEAERAAGRDLKLAIDAMPALAWSTGADGVEGFFNQHYLDYVGLSREQVRGWRWTSAVHPDDLDLVDDAWAESRKSESVGAIEARLRRHDGVYRTFLFRTAPERDSHGKVVRWHGVNTDIEDRKRAEEALRSNAHNLNLILDTIPTSIHVLGTDGSVLYVNRAVLDYTGLAPEDVLRADYRALIFHPDDLQRVHDERLAALKRPLPFELEMRTRSADGSYRWFLNRYSPLLDEYGKLDRWYAASFDIEDRKRIEAELNRVNNRFNHAQQISHVGSFWSDLEADEHLWSDELYRIFELDPATFKITIQTVRDHVHPDDLARYDALAAQSWGGEGYEWAFRIIPKPNVVKHLHTHVRRATEIADRLVFFGTIQDVTEFKRVEDALRQSEALLAEGEAVSGTGSSLWHIESGDIKWSSQLYRIFEFEDGSPVTLERIATRIHPDDRQNFAEMLERAHTGLDLEYEQRLLMADGRIKNLRFVARFEKDGDGRPQYRGISEDVTERRRSEHALSRVQSELAHVTRVTSLNTLTASIAHEINQPLSGIMTNASTCLRKLAAEAPDLDGARVTVQRLMRDVKRASEVIARLRTLFSKKEAAVELVDLNEAAREVIALSQHELRRNKISVRLELDDGLPAVAGDRVQLQQVILNLTLNASDAMCAVPDRPRRLLVVTRPDGNGGAQLAVSDTGVGLGDGNVAGLFEAFYTTKPSGMGIGLSVSRSIIEAHQGRLWAKPNEGPGATFLFSVPCAEEAVRQARLQHQA
jgi:PAS domain S-box-containing protein